MPQAVPTAAVALTLPFPPASLSPNARKHWAAKAVAVQEYRAKCWAYALNGKRSFEGALPLTPPVEADVVFVVENHRRRDLDNLIASFKAGWDGLVDAGLLADDNAFALKPRFGVEVGEKRQVRVSLRGAE